MDLLQSFYIFIATPPWLLNFINWKMKNVKSLVVKKPHNSLSPAKEYNITFLASTYG